MERLSRILLLRLRQTRRSNNQRGEPKVFALTAASPTIDLKLRARVLAEALARLGLSAAIVGEEAEHPAIDRATIPMMVVNLDTELFREVLEFSAGQQGIHCTMMSSRSWVVCVQVYCLLGLSSRRALTARLRSA